MADIRSVILYRLSGQAEVRLLRGKPDDPFPLFVGNFPDFDNPGNLLHGEYMGLTKRSGYLKYREIEKE